jgi:hemerythrin-like metal-binding domain
LAFIEWSEQLRVGIDRFDDQHKILIEIIGRLYNSINSNVEIAQQEGIITELLIYTNMHFAEEEKYFAQFNYPDKSSHQEEHEFFYDKIKELSKSFYSGIVVNNSDILVFLLDWLIKHITVSDKKYASFFEQKGFH